MDDKITKTPQLRFKGFYDAWQQRKLGEISKSFSGGTPSAGNKNYYGGRIPFIRSGEINSNKTELFLTDEGLRSSSAKLVNSGDLLYALYGATSGEVGISQIDGAINQAILAIYPDEENSTKFLAQWLNKNKQLILDTYLQGGQGNLSGQIVKNLHLTFPLLFEQTKIGQFFQVLDQLIALQKRKVELMKELKKGYLQKMFPKDGAKVPDLRFGGFTQEWSLKRLGEILQEKNEKSSINRQFPQLTSSREGIKFQTEYFNDREVASKDNTGYKIIQRNEFTYRSMTDDGFFKFNIQNLVSTGLVSPAYPVFSTNINMYFTFEILNSSLIKKQTDIRREGGTRQSLPFSKLVDLTTPIPPIDEQTLIGRLFQNIDSQISQENQKLALLSELKKSYLQKMFI